MSVLAPVAHSLAELGLASRPVLTVDWVWTLVVTVATTILFFDWVANLPRELNAVWRSRKGALGVAFLCSRYAAVAFGIFFVTTFSLKSESACTAAYTWPFLFTLVGGMADLVLLLRVHALYFQSKAVLVALLSLFALQFGAAIVGDLFFRPVFLSAALGEGSSSEVCFIKQTSNVFALAFLAPSVFHHLLLLMSAWRVYTQYGDNPPLLAQRLLEEQLVLVLCYCLTCFSNVVLVFIPDLLYSLVNQFLSLVVMQALLARIVFHTRESSKLSLSSGAGASPAHPVSLPTPNKTLDDYTISTGGSLQISRGMFSSVDTEKATTTLQREWNAHLAWDKEPSSRIAPFNDRPTTAGSGRPTTGGTRPTTGSSSRSGRRFSVSGQPGLAVTTDTLYITNASAFDHLR